jgi:hypothetical protein
VRGGGGERHSVTCAECITRGEKRRRREEEQRLAKEAEEKKKLEAVAAAELEVHSEKSYLFLNKSQLIQNYLGQDRAE